MERINHPRIIDLKVLEDFEIIAFFSDGSVKKFNFKPLLKEEVYKDLSNPSFFKMAKIDAGGYGISWSDLIDIDSNDIWVLGEPAPEYNSKKKDQ
ncbi:DUF2442 domain-containing protein [bacterium]|nr:DUF2442 domain-containing protein [bacterium]